MPVDELRHSLSDASAAVEALSRRLDPRLEPDERQLLTHVQATIRRFEEVIDALIAYERATDPIDAEPVELGDVIATAIHTHAHELEAADRVELEDLPTVAGHRSLLHALFRPLIENAIKYRHPDRRLELRVWAERADDRRWRIVVEDNGIGIAPGDLERIFEMFERSAPGRVPGQGLGLAAARRIAEAHGGAISACSGPGGTQMHVVLPMYPPPR